MKFLLLEMSFKSITIVPLIHCLKKISRANINRLHMLKYTIIFQYKYDQACISLSKH